MTETIISISTAIITFILGKLAKKYKWIESNYIPLQNLLIGFFAGIMLYASGINDNIFTSIVICLVSAFGAGGIYDLTQTEGSVENGDTQITNANEQEDSGEQEEQVDSDTLHGE